MARSSLLLFVLLFFIHAKGQMSCGSKGVNDALLAAHPEFAELWRKADSMVNNAPPRAGNTNNIIVNGVHVIPVVVHIIHIGDALGSLWNPTDQQVADYITHLNQAFTASYPGFPTPTTGGQDIGIQFALAQRSPDCNPTNGIVRVNAATKLSVASLNEYTSWGVSYNASMGLNQDTLLSLSRWPNLDYYNIWLVRGIGVPPNNFSGYAYYPTGTSTIYDGAVITVLDLNNGTPSIVAHEIGHGFDLRHTFEGSSGSTCPPNNNCATDGDMICDTDPCIQNTNGCITTAINPCTNLAYGNLVNNYMSYSCQKLFTANQKTRMINAVTMLRHALDTSLGGTSLALVPPGPNLPTPTITISTPQTILCASGTLTFTATVTLGGLTPTYQWKVNGVNAGTNSATFTTGSIPNNGIVTCQLTSSISPSCLATTTVVSNGIQITLSTAGNATISIAPTNGNLVCAGIPCIYNATVTNAGSNPAYNWTVNNISAGAPSSSTFSYIPTQGDQVRCILNNVPCPSSGVTSNVVYMYVNPMLTPTLITTVDTTAHCVGDNMTVLATTNYTGPFPSFQVFVNGSMVATGLGPHTIPLPTTGNREVYTRLVTNYQCSNPQNLNSDTVTVTVSPYPTAPVITNFGNHLGSNYPNGQNQWYETTTGILSGEVNQLLYPAVSGHYYDVVTVSSCPSPNSDTVNWIKPSGINEINNENGNFHPNPSATGIFMVPKQLANTTATIINSLGQTVLRTKLKDVLDLHQMPVGLYLLKIENDPAKRSYKLVVTQ